MRLTKLQMARVIVQALYDMPALPPEDHREVVLRAGKGSLAQLQHQHRLACDALHKRAVGA